MRSYQEAEIDIKSADDNIIHFTEEYEPNFGGKFND